MASNLTIEDIARTAGVSVSTVSRILNDKPDVAEKTRMRVLRIIDELGYRPHSPAQSLAGGKSRMIALLFPFNPAGFTQLELDFFIGAADAATERNYFFNLMTEPMDEASLLNLYRSASFDGTILMQICLYDERVELLRASDYPFVMIGRCADNTGLSYIDLDFEAAIQTAYDYLFDLGHQQIGLLTAPADTRARGYGPAVRSMQGYQRVCASVDWPLPYLEVNRSLEDTYQATTSLLNAHPAVTAVINVNGATSAAIIRAAQDCGREIPKDFSVIGIATSKIAQLTTPTLTTIDFPTGDVGYRAAQLLIDKLQGTSGGSDQILLAPHLIVRESTGPIS
jgi:DNA-binding LacI/PurR family transcriptional regulator